MTAQPETIVSDWLNRNFEQVSRWLYALKYGRRCLIIFHLKAGFGWRFRNKILILFSVICVPSRKNIGPNLTTFYNLYATSLRIDDNGLSWCIEGGCWIFFPDLLLEGSGSVSFILFRRKNNNMRITHFVRICCQLCFLNHQRNERNK